MSPEQTAGDALDGRSDLFSLGVVLYECATGQRPFVGNSAREVLSAILHKAPMAPGMFNPDLPLRLQQVISDCLEKDPDLRYQNAAGLRADLKRVKRDLESGRTASLTTAGDPRTTTAASGERMTNEGTLPPDRTPPPSDRTPPLSTPSAPTTSYAPRVIGAALVIGLIGAAAIGYVRWSGRNAPEVTAVDSSASAFVQSRFELAEQSLQARQFSRRATVRGGCAGCCAHACEGPGHSRSGRRVIATSGDSDRQGAATDSGRRCPRRSARS